MRINIMFGLDHDAAKQDPWAEVTRVLNQLACDSGSRTVMKPGDAIVILDESGKRIGVLDVFKD